MLIENFSSRHIGITNKDLKEMLETIKVESVEQLIKETVPENILLDHELNIPDAKTEYDFLNELKEKSLKNKVFKNYIGMGYYDCITPYVIQRNIFENPGWYTSYTPYQAEISQGRLESLLNFQTMISDLTGMPIANASLLDEGTAAGEAMSMFLRVKEKEEHGKTFLVSKNCLPQTIGVMKSRAKYLEIDLQIKDIKEEDLNENVFGLLLQYPDEKGSIEDITKLLKSANEKNILTAVASDLLALALLTPPGELGADCVFGSSQRFGVPLGYGGPHAAFFATKDEYKRQMPGRVIGISVDQHGNKAYRMALQTREQHIKRDKATSNICTAQALLSNMSAMYAVYHGSEGIKNIATRVHNLTVSLEKSLLNLGYKQLNTNYFDTLHIELSEDITKEVHKLALDSEINFRYIDSSHIGISLDETTTKEDVNDILKVFSKAIGKESNEVEIVEELRLPNNLIRTSKYLTNKVFNTHHSETKMLRYLKELENKDISLTHSMIPLGSCTMKLNASSEMIPLSWSHFSKLHPFVPVDQAKGYLEIFNELETYLSEITGFAGTSLQPNSGAQGEFAGLMVIRAYLEDIGQSHRNIALIPSSAHGTNPASAVMAGMKVVVVNCVDGKIDVEDLKLKVGQHKDNLAAFMVTYPSTYGLFEEGIKEICQLIHDNGGQVYMDGANMNAQVGLTSPANIGADVCHLNLHKTFAIPHGGGGPGMGPICVASHLVKYLPSHQVIKTGGEKGIDSISAAPWGSASILLISYAYIKMLGSKGLKDSTIYSILNANYIKGRLENYYPIVFKGSKGRVAHEMIIDLRDFKISAKIEVEDVAKRLMDYGYHAPTMSWPVPGTMMIEPTESEDKEQLDRFCDAMISIWNEIKEVEKGDSDINDNVLKNSPHTSLSVMSDTWEHKYSREKAVYPLPYLKENKFWVGVGRINNAYGDRHLVCTCPSTDTYQ